MEAQPMLLTSAPSTSAAGGPQFNPLYPFGEPIEPMAKAITAAAAAAAGLFGGIQTKSPKGIIVGVLLGWYGMQITTQVLTKRR